ncbi:hypothetical protein [Spirosoma sp. KNUC1025]|uniref:hypothetical protein n=1 Tax=Spirosoma sp. KNUC1025 TaxID=2894082 RepID=UPI00386455D2|nr:hypothetical protein LN737_27805 [Spirosoma sp. KNUC1025]
MTKLYHSFCLNKTLRSYSAWIVAIGFFVNVLVSSSLLASPDKRNLEVTQKTSALSSGSIKLDCVTPTFGSITYTPNEIFQGGPSSLTSTITGLLPSTTQTFVYTIDGVVQTPSTVTSDATGKVVNPLSAEENDAASHLSVGVHTIAITEITANGCSLTLTSNNTTTLTVKPSIIPRPDLSPVIYSAPTTQYGTSQLTVVVDVFELKSTATTQTIRVFINKAPQITLSLPAGATSVGGRSVQNADWSFSDSEDPDYYVLTTTSVIGAGNKLSFGLMGTFTSGSTSGTIALVSVVEPFSGGELQVNNNMDSDRIDYFGQ